MYARPFEDDAVDGELAPVSRDAVDALGVVGPLIGLVVDDDAAVVGLDEQVDVALDRAVADVAMLDSVAVDDRTPSGGYSTDSPGENGFYQALLEARVPFEYVDADHVEPGDLQDFLVVVIPSAPNLPPNAVEAIREFVRRGGSIIADQRTSLVDHNETRSFALGDVLGVDLRGDPVSGVRNNYIELDHEHPIGAGFAGATTVVAAMITFVLGALAMAGEIEVAADDLVVGTVLFDEVRTDAGRDSLDAVAAAIQSAMAPASLMPS